MYNSFSDPYQCSRMRANQGMYGDNSMSYNDNGMFMGGIASTQKSIKEYVCLTTGCTSVEVVDEFDTNMTRHICPGSKRVILIERGVIPVPTNKGIVNVGIMFCRGCGKLILDRSSMEVY